MKTGCFFTPLFVPGHRPERFEKAAASGADSVIIDLEDAVPNDAKDRARDLLRADFTDLPVMVRINSSGSPWFERDLEAIGKLAIEYIMIPKAQFDEGLLAICALKLPLKIVALIESARGLAHCRRIAQLDPIVCLAFGSIDYSVDLGCAHTAESLLCARSELVLASKLGGKAAPLDGITSLIDDDEATLRDARHARDLGFGGKLCIHPRQIRPARDGFRPDQSEIDWATRIVESGTGVTKVDQQMVDEPVRLRARAILSRA